MNSEFQFISDTKIYVNINFIGEYSLEEIINETLDYIRENKNNPKMYADITNLPYTKKKYKLVKANLW